MANIRVKLNDDGEFEDGEVGINGDSDASLNSSDNAELKSTVSRRKAIHQVIDLQQDAYRIARKLAERISPTPVPSVPIDPKLDITNDDLARLASAFSTVLGGWTKAQDTKREIKGKGKPMPVPSKPTTNRKSITYEIDETAIAPTLMNDAPASPGTK